MFHMLVGLVFFVLAGAGATVSFKLWGDYRRSPAQGLLLTFGMVASFTVLLILCCLYSFAKARSVR